MKNICTFLLFCAFTSTSLLSLSASVTNDVMAEDLVKESLLPTPSDAQNLLESVNKLSDLFPRDLEKMENGADYMVTYTSQLRKLLFVYLKLEHEKGIESPEVLRKMFKIVMDYDDLLVNIVKPNFKGLPQTLNVMPKGGGISGGDPKQISDAKAREAYEAAIAQNQRNIAINNLQGRLPDQLRLVNAIIVDFSAIKGISNLLSEDSYKVLQSKLETVK